MMDDLAGEWTGKGATHLDEPFEGALSLQPVAGGNGLTLAFRATGADETVFYRLRGVIAGSRLAFVDNHIGELKILDYDETAEAGFTFRTGDPEDTENYRLEIVFELMAPDVMDIRFSWGFPGEEFGERSTGRLKRA